MTCNGGKKLLLIVNPIAGRLAAKPSTSQLVHLFCEKGYEVTFLETQSKGHATSIVLEYGADHDLVVCCGGDGTLNEVISGVMKLKRRLPVGYIPAGTTNDFANSLNLSYDLEAAAQAIVRGNTRTLDIGAFNGSRYFNYVASFGAFTGTSYSTPQSYKNAIGHFAYILEGMKDLPNIRPYHVRVEANGEVYEDDYIFGAVCNSTSIGGIVKLDSDQVDMNDGLFELLLVKNPKRAIDLHKIWLLLLKKEYNNEMIVFLKAKEANFTMEEPVSWSIDGEYEAGSSKINIRIVPDAVTMLGVE
jgi:diacylglycerol kinase (ATP)